MNYWKSLNFWKRRTDDPLANLLFDKYGLNLVSLPREKINVGDAYVNTKNKHVLSSSPGNISNLLEGDFHLPKIKYNEILAPINETISNSIIADIGLKFLESFLNSLSNNMLLGTKIKLEFERKHTHSIRFNFNDVRRDFMDPYLFGSLINKFNINKRNAIYGEERNYYIVTSVVRSPSVSIIAETDKRRSLAIDVDVIKNTNNNIDIGYDEETKEKIIFKGQKALVFAVGLFQLNYNTQKNIFQLEPIRESYKVHGDNNIRYRKILKPFFIDDEVFIDII